MESTGPSGYVVPQPRIPKVIGILNIVFAAALLICGACSGIYAAMMPSMAKMMTQVQAQADTQRKAQIQQSLESVAKEEKELEALPADQKNAQTEAKKGELTERRRELEESLKRPSPMPMFDMSKMGLDDPKLIGWWATDVVTALILNVLMLVSGIALVRFKPSGLSLGKWVAGLKIARLVVLYSVFIVVIVPPLSRNYARAVVDMFQQQQAAVGKPLPPALGIDQMTRLYTIMYSITGVAMMVLGGIYPIVTLWLLSRPGARAACLASKKLEERGEAW